MANPDRQTKPKIYRTEQDVQNSSFDESYQVTATEMLVENSAQTALVRLNEDMLGGGTGTAAYSDASDVSKKGLVDADRHVQVDVLTLPAGGSSGTQYTEGDTDSSITGTAILWEDGSDTLRAVSAAKPLPVDIQDSTVAVTQSGSWSVTDYPQMWNGSAFESLTGNSTNGLDVDVTRVSGTVTVDGSGVTQPVSLASLPPSTAPSSVVNGQKTVTTAGTQVAIAASTAVSGVIVQALSTNTGLVYVGDSSVSSTTGFELQPGQATSVAIDNLNKVYVDSTVNGEGVSFIGS